MTRRLIWYTARQMWRNGRDTLEIAKYFGVSEAQIYNGLLVRGEASDHDGQYFKPARSA